MLPREDIAVAVNNSMALPGQAVHASVSWDIIRAPLKYVYRDRYAADAAMWSNMNDYILSHDLKFAHHNRVSVFKDRDNCPA
jgi:hypothetical protein